MKTFILIAIQCLFFTGMQAQDYLTKKTASSKQLKTFQKGELLMMSKDLNGAIKEFSKLIAQEPSFIDAHLLRADAEKQLGNMEAAEAGFKKVLEIDPKYRTKVHYVLGMMNFRQERYADAAVHFENYLPYAKAGTTIEYKANTFLANANFAKEAVKNPLSFKPENMGAAINSPHMDYFPSISVDGNMFVFTRQIGQNEDFWYSLKEEGEWQTAVNMGGPVNTMQNEGAQSLSADGRFLTYTVCNRKGDLGKCDIYIAERKDGTWSTPKNIGAPISSPQWESQPSISADGNTLIFVRATDSRSPNSDIFVSYKKNKTWSKPERLGKTINTPFAEEAPFLHPDGQTLYFVSNGHPGMGKGDIFLSRKQDDGNWGKAENAGYPLNSQEKEMGLIVSFDGTTGYFTSKKEGGEGKFDIYSFPMPEKIKPQAATYVQAVVYDAVTKKPLVAQSEFVDLGNSLVHASSTTNEQGEFLVCLPLGKNYALNVSKPTYLFHSENFALQEQTSRDEPYILKIYLQPIPPKQVVANAPTPPVSKPIILKNVFFDTGSWILLDASRTELDKLAALLAENPHMNIQLNGHTDNVGADADNMTLSTNRAKSVKEYLEKKGIASSRLSYKGFGENSPIDTNESPEGRANNRRTEFQILN